FPRVIDPQSRHCFAIERCDRCGLGRTTPVPEDLDAYYGDAYYGGRHGFTAEFCAARRVGILERAARGRRGRVLDIGAGEGPFLVGGARAGWEPFAVERGDGVRGLEARGIRAFADVEVALGRAPFAAITLWHVLEHLTDPLGTVERARDALAEDGVL